MKFADVIVLHDVLKNTTNDMIFTCGAQWLGHLTDHQKVTGCTHITALLHHLSPCIAQWLENFTCHQMVTCSLHTCALCQTNLVYMYNTIYLWNVNCSLLYNIYNIYNIYRILPKFTMFWVVSRLKLSFKKA